ncbi:non-homologous end joining protein Ku [Portibacter lacus]|uniref:Non-homologous end joining protein Ku n=1 Tax=Portibacter lacus TaxID=1099794 RepID=A0AA37SL92_9BACT|nr:Ku protein [Portibacter lacus]GLR16082.1 non-homologous end joining protein Ku [Portibacter lacus]
MRSVWKGHIRFSLVTIPIQIFNAVETNKNIKFNQLHRGDLGRVSYQKTCKSCESILSKKDIVKGFEYEPDQYVVIEPEDLNSLKLKSTRAIDIEAFVDVDEVHPSRFEAVYYVAPNGEVAQKTFNLFNETLKKTGKAGVGRIILRDREDVVLLVAEGEAIIMYKLRYPYEIRSINDVPGIENEKIEKAQLDLAINLVTAFTKKFEEVDFTDRYRDAVMELVQEKIDGKEVVHVSDEEEAGEVVDIMDALKASIEKAKGSQKQAG